MEQTDLQCVHYIGRVPLEECVCVYLLSVARSIEAISCVCSLLTQIKLCFYTYNS